MTVRQACKINIKWKEVLCRTHTVSMQPAFIQEPRWLTIMMDNSAIDVIGQWKMPLQITCCIFHCPPLQPLPYSEGSAAQLCLLSAQFFSTTADMKQSWPLIIHNHNGNLELTHKRIFRHLFLPSPFFQSRKKSLMSTSRSSISSYCTLPFLASVEISSSTYLKRPSLKFKRISDGLFIFISL